MTISSTMFQLASTIFGGGIAQSFSSPTVLVNFLKVCLQESKRTVLLIEPFHITMSFAMFQLASAIFGGGIAQSFSSPTVLLNF